MAVVLTAVGILACGLSNSLEMFIAARFVGLRSWFSTWVMPLTYQYTVQLSGMGGGGLSITASIIISDMYTHRERSLVQGIGAIFNAVRP